MKKLMKNLISSLTLGLAITPAAFADGSDTKLAMNIASHLLNPACADSVKFLNKVENQVTGIDVQELEDKTVYTLEMHTPHDEHQTESVVIITVGMPQYRSGSSTPSISCQALRSQ